MNKPKLKLTTDSKVSNSVTKSGRPNVANAIGLPSGRNYSCVDATDFCLLICYAGRLEKVRKNVREALLHNWNLLKNATQGEMEALLFDAIDEFVAESCKKNAPLDFRIHWDGDFFNDDYTNAWISTIKRFSNVNFWVYTRVANAAIALKCANTSNLSLYYSADPDNKHIAEKLYEEYGILFAYVDETFDSGVQWIKSFTGKPGAKCPENVMLPTKARQLPLTSPEGSACARCRLCIDNKAVIRFSKTKR